MIRLFAQLAVVVGLFVSGAAQADTITFGNEDIYTSYGSTYSEAGYLFTNTAELDTWGNLDTSDSDTTSSNTLFTNFPQSTTTITRVDSAAFDLASIDFDDVYHQGSPSGFLSFAYTFAGGGTGTGSFLVDTVPGLATAILGLTNLASFSFTPDANLSFVQFDNAQVSLATTPIPAALPLFASALVGLGVIGGRRKQRGTGAA